MLFHSDRRHTLLLNPLKLLARAPEYSSIHIHCWYVSVLRSVVRLLITNSDLLLLYRQPMLISSPYQRVQGNTQSNLASKIPIDASRIDPWILFGCDRSDGIGLISTLASSTNCTFVWIRFAGCHLNAASARGLLTLWWRSHSWFVHLKSTIALLPLPLFPHYQKKDMKRDKKKRR